MSKSAPSAPKRGPGRPRRWLRPSEPDRIVTLRLPEIARLRLEEFLQHAAAAGDMQVEYDLTTIKQQTDRA